MGLAPTEFGTHCLGVGVSPRFYTPHASVPSHVCGGARHCDLRVRCPVWLVVLGGHVGRAVRGDGLLFL